MLPNVPQMRAIRPKNQWKPRQMSQLQGCAYPGWHPKNWSGPENLHGACEPTKTARNSKFRKNVCAGLSQPEVPARVMSYWSESPCSSRLHESRRDREEFFGPENWLVTGAARHEMPQKGPQMSAIWPKNRPKPRQMSPTARLGLFGMAPRNLVGPRKSARSVPTKTARNNHFRKNI